MSDVVLIRLGSQYHDRIHWLVWSPEHRTTIASGELKDAGELDRLQSWCQQREVVVLVPGCDMILKTVSYPGRVRPQNISSLAFMLEEEIGTDPESLHTIVLAHKKSLLSLAAVDMALMQLWLTWLKRANITPQRMIPDVLALPCPEAQRWEAMQLGEQWLIRQEKWSGAVLDSSLFSVWLACHQETPVLHFHTPAPDDVPAGDRSITLCPFPLQLLVENIPSGKNVNLLQGAIHSGSGWRKKVTASRLPLLLAALLLVTVLVNQFLADFQLFRQQEILQQEMSALYRQYFPDVKRVVNPYLQFRQKLAQRNAVDLPDGFFALLKVVDDVLKAQADCSIQSIYYDGAARKLRIRVIGPSFDAVRQIGGRIPTPYRAEFSDLVEQDGRVAGLVIVGYSS